jgi:hypothetical protein
MERNNEREEEILLLNSLYLFGGHNLPICGQQSAWCGALPTHEVSTQNSYRLSRKRGKGSGKHMAIHPALVPDHSLNRIWDWSTVPPESGTRAVWGQHTIMGNCTALMVPSQALLIWVRGSGLPPSFQCVFMFSSYIMESVCPRISSLKLHNGILLNLVLSVHTKGSPADFIWPPIYSTESLI